MLYHAIFVLFTRGIIINLEVFISGRPENGNKLPHQFQPPPQHFRHPPCFQPPTCIYPDPSLGQQYIFLQG